MGTEEVDRAHRMLNEGIFVHQCVDSTCSSVVEFDDEPWCFTHSPDEGSSLHGWSARRVLAESVQDQLADNARLSHNVFDKED
jgi:hypothetical protein